MESELLISVGLKVAVGVAFFSSVLFVSPGFAIYLKMLYESVSDEERAQVPYNVIKDFRLLMIVFATARLILISILISGSILLLTAVRLPILNLWNVAIIFMSAVVLILLSEVASESLIIRPQSKLSAVLGYLILLFYYLTAPVVKTIMQVSKQLTNNLIPTETNSNDDSKDLEQMIEEERVRSQLEEDELKMIDGIVDLHQMTIKEVMVPRIDVQFIDMNSSYEQAVQFIDKQGYSRIPSYDGTVDNIVGILYAKDLLKSSAANDSDSIKNQLRPAHFVPDSKNVTEMLREFLQKRVHLAVVIDEYGGTAGLITLEDILEEIVGEIQDEHDFEEPLFKKIDENTYQFDAKIDLDDLGEIIGHEFSEDEDFETLGGLILDRIGRVPNKDETLIIEGIHIKIEKVDGRRISWVRIKLNAHKASEPKPE
ncbi:MAG: hypothetical protein B6244_06700 [Candidatus Cloacimonetes bacterium 4572_55]|nr:MAG: hypothetical protein B6244_06700 [Candidatus Cloacimonetes bacterium 4572_55]